jgi:cellulose synthase/poly-beta-1,6-N-acetylglucosamine synthase-like glycosyltransferase
MSYPHTLEDIFSEVRLRDAPDAPHYVSVDSAPLGYADARSRWIAPFFLSIFVVVSVAIILAEPWLRQLYMAYLESIAGIDYYDPASLGVRPIFLAFLLAFVPFINGSWSQKARLLFLMGGVCFLAISISDAILMRIALPSGVGPFSALGNILAGFVEILSITLLIMFSVRMPGGVRAVTMYRRSRYYWTIALISITIGAMITIILLETAETELNFLRNISLLGGLGPGILLFSHIVWPILATLGVISLVRRKTKCSKVPSYSIGIVVPAYNEAEGISGCIHSLDEAAANYPGPCWLYLVDNGSTDATVDVAKMALAKCTALRGQVLLCPERGKAAALNFGVIQTTEDIVVRVDADTLVSPSLFVQLAPYFSDPAVGVVGGIPLPKEPSRLLSRIRAIEVYYNVGYARLAHCSLDAVLCVPGIQTAFRRQALVEAGDFQERMNGEDTDMTVRIGRLGYHVMIDPSIHVFSEVPATWGHLREQRIRWSRSALHVFARNKSAIAMRQGVRGIWTLPQSLWGAFRRPFLLLLLIYGLLVALIEPSVLDVRGGAALGALLLGPGAIITCMTLMVYRRFGLIPFVPAYLIFRVVRAYLFIDMLFTLPIKSPSKQKVDANLPGTYPTDELGPTGGEPWAAKMNNGKSPNQLRAPSLANTTLIVVALLAIAGIALVLRLLFLGQDSFWGDEILSVGRAQLSWEAFREFMQDGVPAMALYYILLHFWVLLGDSEFMVRLLSVIFSVATVPLVYFLGKRLFDAKVGLIAALLLSVNAFHIQYAQEARSYSMLVLLVTLSSLFLIRSIQRPSLGNWAGYTASAIMAVYTHPFALLVLVAHAGSLVFLPKRSMPWSGLFASGVAIGAALAPIWLPEVTSLLAGSDSAGGGALGWIPDLSLDRIHRFTLDLTGKGGDLLLLLYLILVVVGCVAAVIKWASAKASFESWKYALLLVWLFVPIVITFGYSLLVAPALVSRYLTVCLPPLTLLVAVAIWQIYQGLLVRQSILRIGYLCASGVLVAVMVALSVRGASAYYTEVKEDWRGTADLIMSQWQTGDSMLFYVPNMEWMVQHYIEESEQGTPEMRSLVPNGYPNYRTAYQGEWLLFLAQEPDRDRIMQYLPDHANRIWLVLARDRSAQEIQIRNDILAALAGKYQDVERWHSDRYLIRTELYSNPIPGVFGGQWEEIWKEIQLSRSACHGLPVTIVGTNRDDLIMGTEGNDVIHAFDGNDTVNGLGGNDTICGGDGNDVLDGGEGDDTVNGFPGDDIIKGSLGDDSLYGSDGVDQVFGGDGEDTLVGGSANDELNGDGGNDVINGGENDDALNGGEGDDALNSGPGSNILDGGSEVDVCRGRGSNEFVNCEPGTARSR